MRMYTSPDKALVIPEAKGNNHRIVAFLTHGNIKGSGLEADLLPGGADWILRDPDTNTGHLDVRVQFRSKEGHGIYIHFKGVLQIDEKWMEVFTGGPKARTLEFGENEWLGSPIIETSHPDLKWVERSAFVNALLKIGLGPSHTGIQHAITEIPVTWILDRDTQAASHGDSDFVNPDPLF
ncbi:hypothetical protein FPRO05_10626 [Fusarium proliferatum]|uniref:Uncharacterized protein n=1 Tax=Gibberella intermedia TaxID=948311 RepID=A0A365NBY9_GIBIN|nr:hypothetical protein FPRO05_10626 [Fusarium proliferatum]